MARDAATEMARTAEQDAMDQRQDPPLVQRADVSTGAVLDISPMDDASQAQVIRWLAEGRGLRPKLEAYRASLTQRVAELDAAIDAIGGEAKQPPFKVGDLVRKHGARETVYAVKCIYPRKTFKSGWGLNVRRVSGPGIAPVNVNSSDSFELVERKP